MNAFRELWKNTSKIESKEMVPDTIKYVQAGFRVNFMLVWDVPEERLERVAREAAKLDQVTHCYVRERREEFDYNLYTMVHETSQERFEALKEQLKAMIEPVKYCDLRTVRELKKTGMKYFI